MEIWKKVNKKYGQYEVSSEGRLRRGSRILKPRVHPSNGYVQAQLYKDGVKSYPLMHRLVMETFEGDIPDKKQVNHKNGNRSDNRAENLEIVTCSENNLHSYRELDRKPVCGESHGNAKLTEIDVLDIRWLYGMGVRQYILAKEYLLDKTVIRDIVHRYRWKHI